MPAPPSSSGIGMPSQPISPSRATISDGKRCALSCSSMSGATSASMKSRIGRAEQGVLRREVEVHRGEGNTGRRHVRFRPVLALADGSGRCRRQARRSSSERSVGLGSTRHASPRHPGPPPPRRRVNSPEQLAVALGASRTGVLQQLRALEATHLVTRQTVRHGVGRPRHLYDVDRPTPRSSSRRTTTRSRPGCWPRSRRSVARTSSSRSSQARRRQIGERVRAQHRPSASGRAHRSWTGSGTGGHPGRAGLSRRRGA